MWLTGAAAWGVDGNNMMIGLVGLDEMGWDLMHERLLVDRTISNLCIGHHRAVRLLPCLVWSSGPLPLPRPGRFLTGVTRLSLCSFLFLFFPSVSHATKKRHRFPGSRSACTGAVVVCFSHCRNKSRQPTEVPSSSSSPLLASSPSFSPSILLCR